MDALDNASAIIEGRVTGKLASLLSEFSGKKDSLIVSDPKLASSIKKIPGLDLSIISDPTVQELYRVIREHITALISGLTLTDMSNMILGLSHSLSRHKLKFSPDKVDTMIIQAIVLLDDLDKELNIYVMPDQILSLSDYRIQLSEYLHNRMQAIAPNLTALVGELVGARLIAHAGSLLNLAKQPASTIQILGAEKALFRALKTKHDTPKYGLIYHASLIGQASAKNKGKIARVLATKAAISLRVDAMGEKDMATIGIENKSKVEARLRMLEGGKIEKSSISTGKAWKKYQIQAAPKYNIDTDIIIDMDSQKSLEKNEIKELISETEIPKNLNIEIPKIEKKDQNKKKKKRKMNEAEQNDNSSELHDKSKHF
ncbi:unnamed protein product [Pneumocystis jirovecii]|uniref:Nucleolar protein 58 n=1 Tax=Pneumocystis jirovecii TaxID=42068 RepID=L0PBB7_PNEJI|nr:unnamed protein product [Pneumocystis jirovecii]